MGLLTVVKMSWLSMSLINARRCRSCNLSWFWTFLVDVVYFSGCLESGGLYCYNTFFSVAACGMPGRLFERYAAGHMDAVISMSTWPVDGRRTGS